MAAPWLSTAKSAYVGLARGTGRVLDTAWPGTAATPPRTHRTRHWLTSLTQVHDSQALMRLDVPWWTYRAIDVVDTWLQARPRPARAFEYGSGASTGWLARRCAAVDSVEHHEGFAAQMEPALSEFAHVTLHVVPPVRSDAPEVSSEKEGCSGQDFADYVATIDIVEGEFDLVVIDGRARTACLDRATPRLAPGALVVFDNSRRRRYREALDRSPLHEVRLAGLTPTLPYPEQTSLLYDLSALGVNASG